MAEVSEVSVAALHAELDAQTPMTLIDVRSPSEFANGHVPGAVNIPMDQRERLEALDKSAPVTFICWSGGRSGAVATGLASQGFAVRNVTGGTSAWIASGYPVE